MSEALAATGPQPKLSDQVAELERQLMMHKEMVRDKQQQIDTLRGELDHVRYEIGKCLAVEYTTARDAVAAAVKEIDTDWDLIEKGTSIRRSLEDDLNRIPLFIRRIWGAV